MTSFTASLPVSASPGVTVTATATSPTGNTSALTTPPVIVANPYIVTTADDNGVDASPVAGSLRAAILAANASPGADTITFAIPGPGIHTITPFNNVPLPAITGSLTLDATTQSASDGTPLIRIDGGNAVGIGLDLAAGSDNSTIKGLELSGFSSAAIQVASSGNTIGGVTTGAGDVIHGNGGIGIHVTSGNGNSFRQNLIYANTSGDITLDSGTNDKLASPTITAVSAVPGLTTIDGSITITGTIDPQNPVTYLVEFFASNASGGPAAVFLNSTAVLVSAAGTTFFTASLSSTLAATQTLTATVTSPVGDTSQFAAGAAPVADPFQVTNTYDITPGHEVGSLRQAIANANANAGVNDTLSFKIDTAYPGPGYDSVTKRWTIRPNPSLPVVSDPVTLDATQNTGFTTSPMVTIDGTSAGSSVNGIVLGPNAGGSAVLGLAIQNFQGTGIVIQSSNNTIGATSIRGSRHSHFQLGDEQRRGGCLDPVRRRERSRRDRDGEQRHPTEPGHEPGGQ